MVQLILNGLILVQSGSKTRVYHFIGLSGLLAFVDFFLFPNGLTNVFLLIDVINLA